MKNGYLASSSDDSIKIWNLNDGKLEATLTGRNGSASTIVALSNSYLAGYSTDNYINIWNINDCF